jgi:spore germination protein KA
MVSNQAVASLSQEFKKRTAENQKLRPGQLFSYLHERMSNVRRRIGGDEFEALYNEILDGNVTFLVDGVAGFFSVVAGFIEGRAVTEPTSQTIIKGPKDAFTEDIEKKTSF